MPLAACRAWPSRDELVDAAVAPCMGMSGGGETTLADTAAATEVCGGWPAGALPAAPAPEAARERATAPESEPEADWAPREDTLLAASCPISRAWAWA